MVALGAAGVVRAGTISPAAQPNSTVTATQTVDTFKQLDITTGQIETSTHDFSVKTGWDPIKKMSTMNGINPILEQFTALSDLIPQDLFSQILADPLVAQDVFSSQPDLQQQLLDVATKAGANAPSIAEYLLATSSLGTELAYSLPPTTVVGTETVVETMGKGKAEITQTQLQESGGLGKDKVQVPSKVTNVHDVNQITQDTVGNRVALSSSNETPLGQPFEFVYAEGPVPFATSTTTITTGGVTTTQTTVTEQVIDGAINVSFFQLDGNRFVSPIVMDVSGSGKLEASNGLWLPHSSHFDQPNSRIFDFFNNGFPLAMEWVGPHDGLLVEPKEDGSVDATCLFGTQGGWDNGYEKLSLRDVNHDGKLTGDELKGLAIWVDANQNAKCDPGELKTVQELGITEINLNHHAYKSTFVMNGQTRPMWDWFPTALEIKHISREAAMENLRADKEAMKNQN